MNYKLERIDDSSWKLLDGPRLVCIIKHDNGRLYSVKNKLSKAAWEEVERLVVTSVRTQGKH